MAKPNPLERLEHQLEKVIEQPFAGRPPFDAKELQARFRAAIAETGTPYVPDRWYVRFPAALQARDAEVRAWVDATWRETLANADPQHWAETPTPQVDVTYDANLTGDQMMVGYEYNVSSGPLQGIGQWARRPRRNVHMWDTQVRPRLLGDAFPPQRRGNLAGTLTRLFVALMIVGVLGLLVTAGLWGLSGTLRRTTGPQFNLPQVQIPSGGIQMPQVEIPNVEVRLPQVNLPGFSFTQREYVATANIYVRRQPSAEAESVGVITKGDRVRFGDNNVVAGEAVQGENRWVDITPLSGYLTGQRQYIWLGALQPQQ